MRLWRYLVGPGTASYMQAPQQRGVRGILVCRVDGGVPSTPPAVVTEENITIEVKFA